MVRGHGQRDGDGVTLPTPPEPTPRPTLSPEDAAYRDSLVALEAQGQQEYDRTVIALSGGALGISFSFVSAFLRDAPAQCPGLLRAAWICWASSLALTLLAYYLSPLAMRKAIAQLDKGTIRTERQGGYFDRILPWLNAAGGLLFIAGVLVMGWFVYLNMRVTPYAGT